MTTSQRVDALIKDLANDRDELFLDYLFSLENGNSNALDIANKIDDIGAHLSRLYHFRDTRTVA